MNWQQFELFKTRTFLPFFVTQFCGAFNDNAYKLFLLTLISYSLSRTQTGSEYYQVIASAIYISPFFIFSALAGQLADKYNKVTLIWMIKFLEVILIALGCLGLASNSISLMMLVLFGMGMHSTFFGPIKYSLLPEQLPRQVVLSATAFLEASTFMAILLGTILGTISAGIHDQGKWFGIVMLNGVACLGLIASFFIPRQSSQHDANYFIDWKLWRSTKYMLRTIRSDRQMFPIVLGISWFWLIGAVILMKLPDYVHYVLGASGTVFALFLSLFSIGIAMGSICISYWLSGRLTLRFVPICMLGVSVFAIDLYWATPLLHVTNSDHVLISLGRFIYSMSNARIMMDFFMLSFCGGLFIVPLYTYLQVGCEDDKRSRLIAANNIINAMAMVLGSVLVMILLKLNLNIPSVFLIMGGLNFIVAIGSVYYSTILTETD